MYIVFVMINKKVTKKNSFRVENVHYSLAFQFIIRNVEESLNNKFTLI